MSPKKPLTLSTAKRKSRISAKLAKKSEIAAKKLDKDVAKLKAKEFRESEVQNSATPDIVATQSWRLATHATTQLANTEQSTEQKSNSQSTTADIDNRHSTVQTASNDPEKTLLEQQQQANAAETQTTIIPKFQDYGSSESTHLGQGPHFDDTQHPLVTLSQLPEIGDIKQQIEPTALTVSMARTTLTQSVRPPIISTEQHHTPLSIDEQVTHQSIKEDAPAASISGKLHAHGEAITSLQWTVAEHQGQFGRLDIDPITGEWHYQLNNNAPKTDALAEGEHQTEQFTVTVSGPNGEQVSTVIVIDVEGSNDLPQILGSHLASINAADSLQTVMGQLHSVDPDHNDVITWAVLDGQGQYGQLSINPLTGQWQYQLNNHANATLALVSGQQVTETFTVTATDQSGHPVSQQVSIQVNGADDAAIIQGEMTGLVTEDTQAINGQLTVSGQLSIQDPDKDQAHFSADSLQGQFGYLTIDVNGHWIYNADNTQATIQSLRSGEHLIDTFIIHSADGTAQNITVTINGTDDKAEISGTTSASLTEDSDTYQGMLRANGNLTITDNDHGPHLFTATEQSGQFGTLTIDELGHWTYIADNSQTAIQALKTGESITDTLVVQTQDGTQQTISITIHGTDDHSVIRGTSVVRVFEDKRLSQGQLHTDGQLWVSNPDTGRAGFAAEQRQGQFGVLSISSDGHWTYIADNNNPSIQALKHGEFVTETLFVKALDGTSQKIEILIKGADDKAIIGGADTATLIEDQSPQHGQLQAHGTLTITDPDAGQAQFTALTDVAGSAGYGHFSIDATGNWTYTVDNTLTAIQQLNTGERLTDSLTISSADGTNHTLTVTITGSDDAPVVAQSLVTTTATEDTAFSFSIPAGTFADIDTGDTLILSTGSLPAWLHFDAATGTFSGTPTNGDVGTSQVTITATDGSGAQVSTIFVLNVGNTNDAPTLTHIATVNATEDGAQVTGQFTATDPDNGDKLTFSIAQPVDGLTVNTDGSWRFDPSHASYQHLAAGQTLTLTMPVTVTDAAGATSSQDLVIKLNGSNDGATIGGVSTGSAKEDNAQITTGQLIVADVDDGEAHFVTQTDTAGTYGHFSLSADGRWSYQLDNSKPEIQQLSEGVMLHENFTVHSADGTTHTISVDIVGTNDAPVLAAQSQSVTEDGSRLSGRMVATDVDQGDTLHFSIGTRIAGFTLNADGSYSFDPSNAAYQHLAQGQTETLSIPVSVTDSAGATATQQLVITVTGSNDGAIINGTDAGAVIEDTQLTTQGQLTVTDTDDQESAFTAQANTAGNYGSFTLAADGHWTYTLNNSLPAVQALGQNATLTDSLTVQSVDGTTQQISITIHGTNDTAIIRGTAVGTVTEGTQVSFSGKLNVTDLDMGEAAIQAIPHGAGLHGEFVVAADGSWTYTLSPTDSAVQALRPGDAPLTDTITVISKDGTASQTLTVFIQGNNDAPTLQAATQHASEDGIIVHGQLIGHDVDSTDILVYGAAQTVPGFTLHADGSYSFDPSNAAYQHLAPGAQQFINIPVTVTDQTGARGSETLQIVVTGTNDAPSLMVVPPMVTFEGSPPMHGRLAALDVDDHDTLTYRATAPVHGFTLNADGSYTFDPADPAYEHLAFGQQQIVNIPVEVIDAAGASASRTIQITLTGTNDVPILNVIPPRNVVEGEAAISGQLAATDKDDGATLTYSLGQHVPGFTLDANGQYHFDPADPHYNYLPAGQKAIVSVPVIVTDEHGGHSNSQIQITVTGTNDVPIVGGIDHAIGSIAGAQGHTLRIDDRLVVLDLDQGESHFQAQLITGSYGVLEMKADGSWTYVADTSQPALVSLPATGHVDEHFTVRTADGTTHTINIQLKGSNAPAIFAGTAAAVVQEDQAGTIQQHLDVMDPDRGESAFTPLDQATHYGHFTISATGDWTYQLDNSNPAVQELVAGKTLTDSIVVGSVDGTPTVISVTIMGTNDVAVIGGTHTGDVVEDLVGTGTTLTADGQLTVTDADAGQEHFVAMQGIAGDHGYGTFSIDAQGHWTYTADNSQPAIQALQGGHQATDSVDVFAADGTRQTITVTLTGTNDAPTITESKTGDDLYEDTLGRNSKTSTAGKLDITDADQGEARFNFVRDVPSDHGYGTFVMTPIGGWLYTLDNSNPAVQALGVGEPLTDTFTVQSVDGTTHTITVHIVGTNDVPTITSALNVQVSEDQDITLGTADFGFHDVDARDTLHHVTLTQLPDVATQGQFLLNGQAVTAGQHIDAADIPHLVFRPATNFNGDVAFGYKVNDGHVNSAEATGTLHVAGVNDAPTTTGANLAGTEDITYTFSAANFGFGDVDTSDSLHHVTLTALPTSAQGQLLLNGHAVTAGQQIAAADIPHLSFQPAANFNGDVDFKYTVSDGHADSAEATNTLHIASVNDAPTVTAVDSAHAANLGAVFAGASQTFTETQLLALVYANDVDHDKLSISAVAIDPAVGSFTRATNGDWTFHPAGSAHGTNLPVTLTVTDGTATISAHAAVEVKAVLTGDIAGSVTEDSATVITGDLHDGGATLHLGDHQMHGTFGSLDLRDQGHWTYTLDNANPAVQGLKDGEKRTETFTITGPGGQHQDITLTITGTHDAPVISVPAAAPQTIAGVTLTQGIDGADVHLLDGAFATSHTGVPVGTHIVGLYLPGDSHNLLANIAPGDLPTVHGGYDTSNLAAAGAGYQYLSQHQWFGQHLDGGAARYAAVAPSIRNNFDGGIVVFSDGTVGRLVKVCDDNLPNGPGDYVYFNKFDGVNAQHGLTTLSGSGTAGSQVDVFEGTTHLGHATVDALGHWSFVLPQALADGDHALHTVSGGVTSAVVHAVVQHGAASLSLEAPMLGTATEDDAAHTSLSGQMSVTDIDTDDHPVFTAQAHTAGHYGSFAVDAQGHWTYTLDNSQAATNELAAGQTRSETFTVEVTTDSGERVSQTVTVNVSGTDDAPVITSAVSSATGAVTEDASATTATGTLAATDVDAGAHLTWSVAQAAGTYGNLAIDPATGQWTYTLDNSRAATQGLTSGHPGSETFTVTVTDEHGATATQAVTIDVTGTNDGAVITETGTQSGVIEDTNVLTGTVQGQTHHSLTCMGQLAVTDIDQGEATFAAAHGQSSAGFGSFAILPNGNWTYAADNDNPTIQSLPAGKQITDTFEVHSADGTAHTVTVTITGTNDAPTVTSTAGSATGALTEDAATTTATGTLSATDVDVDTGAQLTWSVAQTAGTYGSLAIDAATGQWTYTLDNSLPVTQALNVNDHRTETFTATVTDEHGASSTQTITVQVTGTDDAARVIDMGSHVADLARANLEAAGLVRATDVDSAAPQVVEQTATQGQFGQLSVNAQGIWRFQLDPMLPASQALASGQTGHDTFTVRFSDGTTHDIVIDIRGTSQGPQVANNVVDFGAGASDQPRSFSEAQLLSLFGATDPGGGPLTVSDVHIGAQYGSFAHNVDGSWTFTPAQGVSGNDIPLTITVTDGTASASGAGVIDITPPPNTAPTVRADATHAADLGTTAEDTPKTFTEADLLQLVGANDANAGDILHVGAVTVDPQYGAFSRDAVTGDWTFTPAANFNGNQVPLTISVTDGTTSTDARAKLAVTAVDDVLTVAADAAHPAAMPDIAVNTETTFTKDQLLKLVGAVDPDGDALSISEIHIDPHAGYFAPQPNGDFIFKPAANFHADDLDITLKLTDGTSTVEAHAQLDIKATPGQLAITTVDNALHAASGFETTSPDLAIHGTAVGLPDGTPITVHLADRNHPENSFDLQTSVTGGSWSLSFDQSKVLAPGNHDWSVRASATDLFGTPVDASTEVLYQDKPTASAQHGAATTTLDLLAGGIAGTVVQHVQYSSDGGQSWSDQVPAGFTLAADGHTLQVDPTHSAFSSLGHGHQRYVEVRYEMAQAGDPSATIHQTASVTITGSNQGPTVTAVDAGHAANLGATAEDTVKTFTDDDLIRMVGGHDADNDLLHVAAVRISPEYGSFARDAATGNWHFTPAANYDGSHLPIAIEVTDGQATATGHAMIDITPVADTPVLGISLGAVQLSAAAGAPADSVVVSNPGAAYAPTMAADFGGMYGNGARLIPGDSAYVDDLKEIILGGQRFAVTGVETMPDGRKAAILDTGSGSGGVVKLMDMMGADVNFVFKDGAGHADPQHAVTTWQTQIYNLPGDAGADYINDMGGWGQPIVVDRLAQAKPSDSHFMASIPEDTGVELHITLSDPDPSEHLSLQVGGLPPGAMLSAGTHNADDSWTLAPGDLPGLIMTPPQDYSGDIHLTVKATSTESADHSLSAEKVMQLDISVDPVAEKPSLSVTDLAASQEHSGAVALDIQVDVHHDDGETLSITIENLPPGAVLSDGTDNHDGSWTLSPAQLKGLMITPEADWSGSFALKVTATSTEATGERTSVIQFVGGAVHSVLDSTITVHDATLAVNMDDVRSVRYGQSLPLHWNAGTDHGELVVSNVGGHEGRFRLDIPNGGWRILDDANHIRVLLDASEHFVFEPVNQDGAYHIYVAPEDLDSLTFIPPQGYQGESAFRLTGAIKDEGAIYMVDMPFKVTVGSPTPAPQADAIDDQLIDTANTVAADDGSAVTAHAGDGSAAGADAHAVAPSADAVHHDVAASVGTDDGAHIATTTDPGSTAPAESPTADHLASADANHDGAVTLPLGEEAHTATADPLISPYAGTTEAAAMSPLDHYMQMVGLMPNSIEQQPTAPIELATLDIPSSTFHDMDTDMLDMVAINHFENPLIEEHKTPHFDQYGFQGEHAQLEVNPNDDDLLHSALNDMHNQM